MRLSFPSLPRSGLASAGLFAVLFLIVAGCTVGPSPTVPPPAPTATSVPLPTAAPTTAPIKAPVAVPTDVPTVRPTQAPSLPVVYPGGTRTGNAQVDVVIDAFLSNKVEPRRALVRFLTTPCTTAQGLGGPPKCAAGEANGTPVEVFPEATTEGTFFRRSEIDRALQFEVTGLYGVYRVPASVFRADYWPAGEYAVVFAGPASPISSVTPIVQIILYVHDGSVVRIRMTPFPEPWPPAEAAGATWLLAPVR